LIELENELKNIDKTIQEFKNKKFDKFNGFTKNGFDKKAYIIMSLQKQTN